MFYLGALSFLCVAVLAFGAPDNNLGTDMWMLADDEGISDQSRIVTTLSVSNGGDFGDWGPRDFCGSNAWAVGYDMKIEPWQRKGDDTALNGIKLMCQDKKGAYGGQATSSVGQWGDWVGQTNCQKQNGKPNFLTSFDLQVEPWVKNNDDTSANYVKFKCRDIEGNQHLRELARHPGHGRWGSYGKWSPICPRNTAICGIQTKVEKPQGRGDDTSLNDVRFFCCRGGS